MACAKIAHEIHDSLIAERTKIKHQTLMHTIIMKSLDPSRAVQIFIRKKLGHSAVSAIRASSVTLEIWQMEPGEKR